MTPERIAAQEQRLARLSELHRKPRRERTIEEHGLIVFLARIIRHDAEKGA